MVEQRATVAVWLWPLAERFQSSPYYYVGLAALIAAMIWGAIVAYRSWEEATEVIEPASKDEILEVFRQARNEGELDDAEFERVRSRVEAEPRQGHRPSTSRNDPT